MVFPTRLSSVIVCDTIVRDVGCGYFRRIVVVAINDFLFGTQSRTKATSIAIPYTMRKSSLRDDLWRLGFKLCPMIPIVAKNLYAQRGAAAWCSAPSHHRARLLIYTA